MKKVRIGIVGAGNIATNAHMPAYKVCDQVEIAAVADLNLERAQAFAEKFGIPHAYDSVEEMLANEDIDAVDICTWTAVTPPSPLPPPKPASTSSAKNPSLTA